MKNQESKISREFPLLGIFEYLTYHCESKVLSPEKLSWLYFRHYSPREFRFSLFLFNLHGKTLLRFSRYKRQIHGESSRIGENPSRLERDFLFSFFSLYFFVSSSEGIYTIFPNYERDFLLLFFFIFPYVSTFIYLQWRNELLCIWNVLF